MPCHVLAWHGISPYPTQPHLTALHSTAPCLSTDLLHWHVHTQAQREAREAEKRARKEADRKAIADMMEKNYTEWHTKVGLVVRFTAQAPVVTRSCKHLQSPSGIPDGILLQGMCTFIVYRFTHPDCPTTFPGQEESRLAREVAQAEERSAADEAARKQRIKDTLAAMHRSNQLQLKHKVSGSRSRGS